MAMLLEPPRKLPVDHLSASSINLLLKCPLRWRNRYIKGLQEPISGSAVLGSAVGGALRDSYAHQIESGRQFSTPQLLDVFADSWDVACDRGDEIQWDGEKPGRVKDSGARVLPLYHRIVAPTVKPLAVERGFSIYLPDVEWTVDGYLDVEEEDGIVDVKTRSRTKGVVPIEEADVDLQPGIYLLARRSEGKPVPGPGAFKYHSLVRQSKTSEPAPRDVLVTPTDRTDEQLDKLIELIYRVAAEIAWRVEFDVWTPPPPGAWWCSPNWCGFYESCEFGGGIPRFQSAAGRRPIPARARLSDSLVRDAIAATTTKRDKVTTAAKVAAHLGITVGAAANRLRALPDIVVEQPTKASGRGKDRVVKTLPGPKVYRVREPEPDVVGGLQQMVDGRAVS